MTSFAFASFLLVLAGAFLLGGANAAAIGAGAAAVFGAGARRLVPRDARAIARLDAFEMLLALAAAAPFASLALAATGGDEARVEAYRVGALCLLAAFARRRAERDGVAPLLEAIAWAVGLVAAFGLAQRLLGPRAFLLAGEIPATAVPFGPFVNRSHFAALCAAAVPLFGFVAAGATGRHRRLARTALVGCVVGALFPGARTGGVALGAALLAAVAVGGAKRASGYAIAAVCAAGIAAAAAPSGTIDRLIGGGVETRARIWTDALRLVAGAPAFGVGPGGFADAFGSVQSWSSPFVIAHAESDLVQHLVETGLAGTLPVLLAFVVAALSAARRARTGDRAAAATLAALVAAGAAGVVETPWHGLGFGAFGAVVLGCAAASPRREGTS